MAVKYLTGFNKDVTLANMSDTTKYYFSSGQAVQHITWNGEKYQRIFELTRITSNTYSVRPNTDWKAIDINVIGTGQIVLFDGDGSDTWEVQIDFTNGVSKVESRQASTDNYSFRVYDIAGNLISEHDSIYNYYFNLEAKDSDYAYTFKEI